MLYRYFLVAVACAAILIGIQIPNFVNQYEKRLDAHLIEVATNLRGFQEIADRYHGGSFEALLHEHEASSSPTFRDEAKPLREMLTRRQIFLGEQRALNTHLAGKTWHIFYNGHPELVRETQAAYAYNVPLSEDALIAGAGFAALAVLVTEIVAQLAAWLLAARRRRRTL
jgi:hypothetical protein